MSPVAAKIEEIVLAWMVALLDLPPNCGGGFVTGTTMANFTALAAARTALLKRAGWNVEDRWFIRRSADTGRGGRGSARLVAKGARRYWDWGVHA